MEERVILVDENDRQIGTEEKMQAHREGKLHRAFSIFIFNDEEKMLLQRRALSKYHSGGLWTNACCSHPRENESVEKAAHRRLKEEMGFDTEMDEVFSFTYFAELDKGLKEHEFDHVIFGNYFGKIEPNPEEVDSFKWISLEELEADVKANPKNYTAWFVISLDKVLDFYKRSRATGQRKSNK